MDSDTDPQKEILSPQERIEALEAELAIVTEDRDAWKSQAEAESIVSGSYRDERDALQEDVAKSEASQAQLIKSLHDLMMSNYYDEEFGDYVINISDIKRTLGLHAHRSDHLAEHNARIIESLNFPLMVRKMWSGGEVKAWLDQQAEAHRNPRQAPKKG